MGVYVYYAGNVRRCFLCFVPVVLQYQFRWGLLALDDYSFQFCVAGCELRVPEQGRNLLGKKTYQTFLVINGVVGPLLLGGAVATFFTGSDFYINKANMTDTIMPVISHWGNGWHGLDALTNIWNVILGLAVFFWRVCWVRSISLIV